MAIFLYVFLKNKDLDPILWELNDDIAFEALKQSLMKLPAPWASQLSDSLLPFVCEKEGNALGYSSNNRGPPSAFRVLMSATEPMAHRYPPCLECHYGYYLFG